MKFKKSNGSELEVQLGDRVFFIEGQKVLFGQVYEIIINGDGSFLGVDKKNVSIDKIFLDENEAAIFALKKEIAIIKDNMQEKLAILEAYEAKLCKNRVSIL